MRGTVLITGATGRIGANLARALVGRGYRVRGVVMPDDPKHAKLADLDVEAVAGSLTDLGSLVAAARDVDAIVHLACVMGRPPGMGTEEYVDVNVDGTFRVLEAAATAAPNLRRFIFASSDATYTAQNPRYLPIDEAHPQRPYFLYGLVKVLGEQLVAGYRLEHGLPTVILRFGTVMAGDEILTRLWTASAAIGSLRGNATHPASSLTVPGVDRPWEAIERALDGRDPGATLVIPRRPDGAPWLHHPSDVRDTVDGIVLALEHDAAVGETFNILGPRGVTWEEAVRAIHARTGHPYVEVTLPNYWAFECDIGKARRLLGYAPSRDIHRMIDDALAYRRGEDIGVLPA